MFGPFLTWKNRIFKICILKGAAVYLSVKAAIYLIVRNGPIYGCPGLSPPFKAVLNWLKAFNKAHQFDLMLQMWRQTRYNLLLSTKSADVGQGFICLI